jgi:large subunit ribosomal protein L29
MKSEEIQNMTAEERAKSLKDLREKLGNLAFQHRIRPLEDTSNLKKIRKDIARIETITKQLSK